MNLGYARVSRTDQHVEQQESALNEAGCERVFVDHGVSGATKHRPELDRLLDQLRPGDVIYVTKIDRLSRSLPQMLEIVAGIEERGAGIVSLAESAIDTRSAAGKLVFGVFAVVAEFERDRIRERTNEGLSRAKANGARLGRPARLNERAIKNLRDLRDEGWTFSRLAEVFDISRSTARNYCADLDTPPDVRTH